jgi:hypothetical protein
MEVSVLFTYAVKNFIKPFLQPNDPNEILVSIHIKPVCMKPFFYLILSSSLSASLVLFFSCSKKTTAADLKFQTEQQLQGKWVVQQRIDESYIPISTLSNTVTFTGSSADSVVFTPQNIAYSYSPAFSANTSVSYTVINPTQLWLHDEVWRFETLTATSLILFQEQNDAAQNTKQIHRIYFTR